MSAQLLHVIQRYYPFQGGSERYFQAFSERFAQAGFRVDVVTTDAWDLEYFWDPRARRIDSDRDQHNGVGVTRVPVRHLPLARTSHRAIRRLMAESSALGGQRLEPLARLGSRFGPWLPSLERTLASFERIDLITSANIAFESVIAACGRQARDRDIPHIVIPFLHLGEGDRSRVRRYYTMPHQLRLLRQADAVLALTSIEAEYLASAGVIAGRIQVVGAGLDVGRATGGVPARARDRFDLNGPVVLSLGAAAFDKGTYHLVDAIARLAETGRAPTLVVAGPVLSGFREYVERLSNRARQYIRVAGFVSDDEKRDLLAAADVFALPSRTESFGIVYLEAWANGLPVIGARAGAVPAVIDDGVDGLLVDFGDIAGLSAAIARLLGDSGLRQQLAERGSAKVVDEGEWFKRIEDVYHRLLSPALNLVASGGEDLA